jgi:Protein of unknown function (DUF4235)
MDAEAPMKNLIYRVMSLWLSVITGVVAGAVFKKLWQVAAREDEAPEATDLERSWREILIAAGLQGALFAVVKATVERIAIQGRRKLARSGADD